MGAAAVDDDHVDPHVLEKHDVLGEGGVKLRLHLGRAAVFDDDGLARKLLDVGQRFNQRRRPVSWFHV